MFRAAIASAGLAAAYAAVAKDAVPTLPGVGKARLWAECVTVIHFAN